jgi:hypothetical protein
VANYFLPALIFAQRAFNVSAICARCAALIGLRFLVPAGFAEAACFAGALCGAPAFRAAQRAFIAAEIFARAALVMPPPPVGLVWLTLLWLGLVVWPSKACICFSNEVICSLICAARLSCSGDKSSIVFIGQQ